MITAVGFYTSKELVARHETFDLNVLSRDVGDLVGFYRDIYLAVARQQEVADILQFEDSEQVVAWAREIGQLCLTVSG